MRCITNYPDALQNKIVLIRCDLNLPLSNGQLVDDTRIRILQPLIDLCLKHQATIVLLSHFGNPKSVDPAYSLTQIMPFLPYPVTLLQSLERPPADGGIYLLENLRFFPGEKKKDPDFAKQLATLGDVYINEAFSVCHRDHTSVTMLPTLLPSYAGPHLAKEVEVMRHILGMKERPIVFVIGGSKISTKMPYLKDILSQVDYLIVGGLFANMFLKVAGREVGSSQIDAEYMGMAEELWGEYKDKIVLPVDVVIEEGAICDLGQKSSQHIASIIHDSKMIIWNGVLGRIEHEHCRASTQKLVEAIKETSNTQLIVGGGTTLGFVDISMPQLYHVSTGGGAFLEYYTKKTLPGIGILNKY